MKNHFRLFDYTLDTLNDDLSKEMIINMNKIYYDTQVTRLYIDIKDKSKVEKRFNLVKSLWNNREVVIVEGEKSRLGIGNDLFNGCKSIERIICPSINAFSKYDEIFKEVKKQDKSKSALEEPWICR